MAAAGSTPLSAMVQPGAPLEETKKQVQTRSPLRMAAVAPAAVLRFQ